MKTTYPTPRITETCSFIKEISQAQLDQLATTHKQGFIAIAIALATRRGGHKDPIMAWHADDDFADRSEFAPLTYIEVGWGLLANFTTPSNLLESLELFMILADAHFITYREDWEPKVKRANKSSENLRNAQSKFRFQHRILLKDKVSEVRAKHPDWSAEAIASRINEKGEFPVSASDLAKKIRAQFPDLPKSKAGRKPKKPS